MAPSDTMDASSLRGFATGCGIICAAVSGLDAAPALAQEAQSETPPARAGSPPPLSIVPSSVTSATEKAARQRQYDALLAEQKKAKEAEAALRRDIEGLGEDRRRLSQSLIDSAERVRTLEGAIAGAEERLTGLSASEGRITRSLHDRRGAIAEILAALQRMGRRPPPALLVSPDDALQAVRTAIMLGALLPEMRGEADRLVASLGELSDIRRGIVAEREKLREDLASLGQDRMRVALLIEERQKRQAETERTLDAQRQRAGTLGRQAETVKELISRLDRDVVASTGSAEARRSDARQGLWTLKDPGRLSPAIAFSSAKGTLRLPVNGARLRAFGSPDRVGGAEKGLSLATRPGAQVTAPCDGWVVYAGPFRSYGQLLILNAGEGYHVLLAGVERISVDLGQFVLTGEPVGVMGGGGRVAAASAADAIGANQPVLYVEFRKDGTPIDPSPWWATTESEKVRG